MNPLLLRSPLNAFPALKDGNFCNQRAAFRPDTENVLSSVHIPIVVSAALVTRPVSCSKRAHTFRAAGGYRSAARAHLGRPSFVGFKDATSGNLLDRHVPIVIWRPMFSNRRGDVR